MDTSNTLSVKDEFDANVEYVKRMHDAEMDKAYIVNALKKKGIPDEEADHIIAKALKSKAFISGSRGNMDLFLGLFFLALGLLPFILGIPRIFFGALIFGSIKLIKGITRT